jgi:aryl-alcohol dehydrogenase-like predicted oxidoreductase
VFSFARSIGILPLTGTSNAEHMKQDLASRDLKLPPEAVRAIESLTG